MAEIAIMAGFWQSQSCLIRIGANESRWCVVFVAEIADYRLGMHQWKAMVVSDFVESSRWLG